MRAIKNNAAACKIVTAVFCISVFFLFPAASAQAQTLTDLLCDVWALIACDIGRGVATLAIASLAIGAMLGKVSWGMAISVMVGISIMLGAASLAFTFTHTVGCLANPCM